MPFVQLVKEKMETVGLSALNLTLDFDEFHVLETNKEYLKNTLGVSIHYYNFCIFNVKQGQMMNLKHRRHPSDVSECSLCIY